MIHLLYMLMAHPHFDHFFPKSQINIFLSIVRSSVAILNHELEYKLINYLAC